MVEQNKTKRKVCDLCRSKRFAKYLHIEIFNGVKMFVCKNEDLCVLKMSYLKKKKNICKKH